MHLDEEYNMELVDMMNNNVRKIGSDGIYRARMVIPHSTSSRTRSITFYVQAKG